MYWAGADPLGLKNLVGFGSCGALPEGGGFGVEPNPTFSSAAFTPNWIAFDIHSSLQNEGVSSESSESSLASS